MPTPEHKLKLAAARRKQREEKLAPGKGKAEAAEQTSKATQQLLDGFKQEILGLIKAHEVRTGLFLDAVKDLDRIDDIKALAGMVSKLNDKLDGGITVKTTVKAPDVHVKAPQGPAPIVKIPPQDKAIIEVTQQLRELTEKLKPSQNAKEFIPYRRVIKRGRNDYQFDDSDWSAARGGGSSGGGSSGPDPVGLKDAAGATIDPATADGQTDGSQKTQLVDAGGDVAAVNARTDGVPALEVADDMTSGETFRQALVASTDTTITFSQPVRLVRVKNESTGSVVFVRDGAISSDTPANAEVVGVAPAANVPNTEYYPFKTTTIHLRSAGTPTVNVTGFY